MDIYQVYSELKDGNVAEVDSVHMFSGFADNPSAIQLDWVTIPCFSDSKRISWSPRVFANPPVFNHLIQGGTVIGGVLLEPNDG